MTLNRREWLQTLALAFIPSSSVVHSALVLDDLCAATEPDAMPALDWGDLYRALTEWGYSPWCFVATGRHRDLQTMINDCLDAIAQHRRRRNPTTAIVVLSGDSHRLQLQHCAAVSSAIHAAVGSREINLWFAAARDPVLMDALRVTVAMDG
ncbi:hypothetical protein [Acidovorax radicis]|jgi:hypothetical protein|uniref:hypothetical protein n=1 Tax=Acidovorax radicis TaxID=758826 RepID=UPI001CF94EEF|nr:hypothetical protein [Acidovorax radicis]UCV01014.1 hypothetical protein KI609_09915 [Acidovorax radicis]